MVCLPQLRYPSGQGRNAAAPKSVETSPPVAYGSNPEMVDAFRGRIVRLETIHGLLPNQPFQITRFLERTITKGCLLNYTSHNPVISIEYPEG